MIFKRFFQKRRSTSKFRVPPKGRTFEVPEVDYNLLKLIRIMTANGNFYTISPITDPAIQQLNAAILNQHYGLSPYDVAVETGIWPERQRASK